jgi:AcrR family transcriptional regulator
LSRRADPSASSNISRRRAAALDEGKEGYLARRQAVIQAATEVFKDRGFRGTNLQHVAEALNTDRASLYYYVGSKEELFQEIVTEAVRMNTSRARAIRDDPGPAPEKIRRLISELMASYAENYPVLYVLIQENLTHVEPERSQWANEMRTLNREYESHLIEIIEAGQKEGTLRGESPAWLLAYGVLGAVAWSNRWFNPRTTTVPAEEIGSAFADMLLSGLQVDGGS